jgi:hypothetical protein
VRLASGPLKWVKLVEFLKTTYPRIVNEMLARQEAQVRVTMRCRFRSGQGCAHTDGRSMKALHTAAHALGFIKCSLSATQQLLM